MANAYAPDYLSLVAEIQDICENTNDEFVGNIPKFIWRGQDQVQRDLGLELWRSSTTAAITAASLARDASWLIISSLWLPNQFKFMEQRHVDYVRAHGGLGRPKYWAEDGETTLLIAPSPNSSYPVQVGHYARLAALTADNPSNWITNNAADLLLLQALTNAASYLRNPEKVQEYMGMYQAIQPIATNELRDSERHRYSPVRSAPRPVMQAGASA